MACSRENFAFNFTLPLSEELHASTNPWLSHYYATSSRTVASKAGGACRLQSGRPQKPVWRRMPQLAHGLVRSCCCHRCQLFRRGSAQTLRRAHWLGGLLLACICLTLAGFFNTELPVSVTVVPSYVLQNTLNNIHTAEADLDTAVRNYFLICNWKLRFYSQIVWVEILETVQVSDLLYSSYLHSLFLATSHDHYLIRYDTDFRIRKWTLFSRPYSLYVVLSWAGVGFAMSRLSFQEILPNAKIHYFKMNLKFKRREGVTMLVE